MSVKIEGAEKSLTVEELQKVEEVIGVTLPEEYKHFLMMHNGGQPEPSEFEILWKKEMIGEPWWRLNPGEEELMVGEVDWFLSICDDDESDLLENFEDFKGRIPDDTIAIGYDQGGNYILLGITGTNRGKVFFWMLDFEEREGEIANGSNVGFVANSFNEFLDSLCKFEFEEDDDDEEDEEEEDEEEEE
ncbi:MAG: SMI1/KNR4 family protein [Candidatus Desantisbacteria bacterium]